MWGLFTSGRAAGLTSLPPAVLGRDALLGFSSLMAPERSVPSSSAKGIPCPIVERDVSRIKSGTLKHFGRGVVEESPAHCAEHVILWETSPKARCLLLPEGLSSGRRRPWTPSLLVPLPSLRDPEGGGGRGGGGQGSGDDPLHTPCSGGVCPRLAPMCPLALLSPQYFSTLENSIISLFVLLTTAK